MGVASGAGTGAAAGVFGGPVGMIVGAGIGAVGGYFSAKESGNAEDKAAQIQATSATNAANLQAQAAQQALNFQKEQAENAYQNNEASRQGNYGQFAAGQTRLKSVGEALGIPGASGMQIPAYVPGVDPNIGGAPTAAPAAGGASSATGATSTNPTDPAAIMAQLTKNYQALGVAPTGVGSGPTDIAYYAQQIANTGGLTPQNSAYWFGPTGRIATDISKSGAPSTSSTASMPGSVGSYMTAYAPVPMAPPLTMPSPGSVGSYL